MAFVQAALMTNECLRLLTTPLCAPGEPVAVPR